MFANAIQIATASRPAQLWPRAADHRKGKRPFPPEPIAKRIASQGEDLLRKPHRCKQNQKRQLSRIDIAEVFK
jgi:hypothetical protein